MNSSASSIFQQSDSAGRSGDKFSDGFYNINFNSKTDRVSSNNEERPFGTLPKAKSPDWGMNSDGGPYKPASDPDMASSYLKKIWSNSTTEKSLQKV